MMVEAGANLLPEDVMAEAILFGHRALQPHRRAPGGDPEGRRQGQAHPVHRAVDRLGPRLRRRDRRQARARRHRRRDDRHRSEDVGPRRGRRGQDQGHQGRRPLVDVREPRPADRRQPDARHHRQGRQGRARARRRRPTSCSPSSAMRSIVGHNVGFDLGFIEEAKGDGFRFQPGTLPRHARDRPRGLSRRRSRTSSATSPASSASS